ncbi:MAG: phospholipid carrier-dependent glycosyltransferase [Candidatus Sericytochromatia bacterium]|nr:phospholipid carrier-dependent glycosyltransferase [Candidatus Sericytochromatia bacterium]
MTSEPLPPDAAAQEPVTASVAGSESSGRDYTRLFWYVLIAALLLRLFLIRFPYQFTLDVNTFRSWGDTLFKVGPHQFYNSTWSDYPPLFLYLLWGWSWAWAAVGKLFSVDPMMTVQWVKVPACLADVLNGYLIFSILKGRVAIRSAFRTAAFYLFNPVVLFVSAIWGQVDSVVTCTMLLTTLAVLTDRLTLAAVAASASVFIKPQGIFLIPVVVFAMWHRHSWQRWLLAIAAGLTTAWLVLLPANWTKVWDLSHGVTGFLHALFIAPFLWFANLMKQTGDNYPYSSVNAFNLWMLPPPNEAWKGDDRLILMLPHSTWGLILVSLTLALVAWYLWRNRQHAIAFPFVLSASVALTGYYMLATRMHERYIFPAIAFLALAQAFNRRLSWIYWLFSLTSMLSISYIFFFYNDQSSWVEGLKAIMNNGPMLGNLKLSGMVIISLFNVWLFGELLAYLFVKSEIVQEIAEHPLFKALRTLRAEVRQHGLTWADLLLPLGIAVAFCSLAFWRLGTPHEQIFDEVYHARTAMEYIKGVSPYEWTHPPLAKLIAALGVLAWGGGWELEAKTFTEQQAFAWRFTSVLFGGVALMATYALARAMFANRTIAAAATVLLALDGVFFVQSRVAMTNIYEVAFIMIGTIGTWQFLKRDDGRWLLLTGFGLGCALATRWSSLYAWGLTGLLLIDHAWRVRRLVWVSEPSTDFVGSLRDFLRASKLGMLRYVGLVVVSMGLVPLVIYALSYIPYILQAPGSDWQLKLLSWDHANHGWGRVVAWQKEMWDYHAKLNATHPYNSPWWSWPLMLRPTWYYFQDLKNTGFNGLGAVWAIGNAFIWWSSIPALGYAAFLAWRDRVRALGAIALLGIGLWVMWGVQPRPLLYMHYMFETIPFACLALAYVGYLLWHGQTDAEAQARPVDGEGSASGGEAAPASPPKRAWRRAAVTVFAGVAISWFIYYYPLLSALPVSWDFYHGHVWFGRVWI